VGGEGKGKVIRIIKKKKKRNRAGFDCKRGSERGGGEKREWNGTHTEEGCMYFFHGGSRNDGVILKKGKEKKEEKTAERLKGPGTNMKQEKSG